MSRLTRMFRSRRRGAVAVMLMISTVPILGIMAITLDLGLAQSDRRRAQSSVDAAAFAAANVLFMEYRTNRGVDSNGTAQAAALRVAAASGFTPTSTSGGSTGGATCTIAVNIPPRSGTFMNQSGYAEVILTHTRPPGFSAVVGNKQQTVTSRSVAKGRWDAGGLGILALDGTVSQALDGNGGGTLTTNATVVVNSSSTTGATTGGGSVLTAPRFNVTGGYTGSGFNGQVTTGTSPIPDPLAYLPQPNVNSLTVQSNNKLQITNGNRKLSPGVYRGGINATSSASLTLSPGIYYMDGGGFSFNSQGDLTGSGVMIYNAPQKSNDIISIAGSGKGTINISPPTTGIYRGISVFQDRNATTALNISGSGNFTILGTFYAAGANMKVAGNSPTNYIGSQYIAKTITVTGSGGVQVIWNEANVARFRELGIVE